MILFVIVASALAQSEKASPMALLDATPSYRLVVLNAQRTKTDAEIQLIKRHRLAANDLSQKAIYDGVLAFSKLKESDLDAVMERLDPRLSWSAKDPFAAERDARMCMILEALYVINNNPYHPWLLDRKTKRLTLEPLPEKLPKHLGAVPSAWQLYDTIKVNKSKRRSFARVTPEGLAVSEGSEPRSVKFHGEDQSL